MMNSLKCTPAWVFLVTVILSMCVYIGVIYSSTNELPNGCVLSLWCCAMLIGFFLISSICMFSNLIAWIIGGMIILSACCVLFGQVSGLIAG